MTKSLRRSLLFVSLGLVALLSVGASSALAHGGGGGMGRGGGGHGGSISSALVTKAASKLGVTSAALRTAINTSAKAEIDADDAAELKEELEDAVLAGYKPSRFSFGRGFGR